MIINLTDSNFDDMVLGAEFPVLVDFWAEWCAPCKQMSPIIDELSGEVADKVIIAKANTEECPEKMLELSIRGIPALFIFIDGEIVSQHMGAMTREQILHFIEQGINNG